MKAIGYQMPALANEECSLLDIEVATPAAAGRDLLVAVKAVALNPVDTKVRDKVVPAPGQWQILGWDAAGVVKGIGDGVEDFEIGDEVYYAGDVRRAGSNAEYQIVDSKLVALKPRHLSFAEAAALPLTSLTAWKCLFDRLRVRAPVPGALNAILIIGGAGGVGSMAIQIAKATTDLTIIATASRSETKAWCERLGADYVLDHSKPLAQQLKGLNLTGSPAFVLSTNNTEAHLGEIADMIAPQGRISVIDDPVTLDITPLKAKSISVTWEFMFTRSMFSTEDIGEQAAILREISKLSDKNQIISTMNINLGRINSENIEHGHRLIRQGNTIGKIVLEGF